MRIASNLDIMGNVMDLSKKLKRELIEIVVAQSAEINALRERLEARDKFEAAKDDVARTLAARGVPRNNVVWEFDPDVPGSFVAAMAKARAQGGSVRRARS